MIDTKWLESINWDYSLDKIHRLNPMIADQKDLLMFGLGDQNIQPIINTVNCRKMINIDDFSQLNHDEIIKQFHKNYFKVLQFHCGLPFFTDLIANRYGLKQYYSKYKPCIFFQCFRQDEIDFVKHHMGKNHFVDWR